MERGDVSALVQVLVTRGYDREARAVLLGGLDPRIRGALPGLGRPTDQALSDVQSLLRYGEVGQRALAAIIQNVLENLLDPADQATLVRLHMDLVGTAPVMPAAVVMPQVVRGMQGGGPVMQASGPVMQASGPAARKEVGVRKILFLGANPVGQRRLRIAEEAELIRRELRQAPEGRDFKIEHRFAATYPELQRALFDERPEIVHISCHGVGGDLVFADDANRTHTVAGDAVAEMVKLVDSVRGCLIMACESSSLAEEVATDSTLYAVGLSDAMSDDAARTYSASFYLGLGRGLPIATCHKLGRNAVKAMKVGEEEVPVLFGGGAQSQPAAVAVVQPVVPAKAIATLTMNPWPAPDFAALGVSPSIFQVAGPTGRWHQGTQPGSAPWEQARAGIDNTLEHLAGTEGEVDLFISAPYALGAYLALKLVDTKLKARWWHADGPPGRQVWRRWGEAYNNGGKVLFDRGGVAALAPGKPVAVHVGITFGVIEEEAAMGLAALGIQDAQVVKLGPAQQGHAAIPDAQAAQQAAWDLEQALLGIKQKLGTGEVHLFYVGPLTVLTMASGVLRTMHPVDVVIHDRGAVGDKEGFRPAMRFRGGRGGWI